MTPDRVGRHVSGGREPEQERVARQRADALRDALSLWGSGVTILAVREGSSGPVHALTASAFLPLSVDPPLVLASLGPNASALPYLERGGEYVISILGEEQRGIASRYADTFPVGPSPFEETGSPRVVGSIASLVCEVEEMLVRGDHTLVVGRVTDPRSTDAESALAYFRRDYRTLR